MADRTPDPTVLLTALAAHAKGDYAEALAVLETVLKDDPTNPAALLASARVYLDAGNGPVALRRAAMARLVAPGAAEPTALLMDVLSRPARYGWHFDMLSDTARTQAYQSALAGMDLSDKVVLDIGTGSGLLAMLAAEAGATQVYACEADPDMAAVARLNIAANGLDERITVIAKPSHDLELGLDLPTRADVVVFELFDSWLIGEDCLFTIYDAQARLATPTAIHLPGKAQLMAMPVASARLAEGLTLQRPVAGLDLSAINALSIGLRPWHGPLPTDVVPLAAARPAIEVDFHAPMELAGTRRLPFEITHAGTAEALVCWLTLELGEHVFTTEPVLPTSAAAQPTSTRPHWPLGVAQLDPLTAVAPGEIFELTASYFRRVPVFDVGWGDRRQAPRGLAEPAAPDPARPLGESP